MKKNTEKQGRNERLSAFFGISPVFQPIYPCLFELLSQKKISPTDFAVFSAILHHAIFTLWGKTIFPLSNSQVQAMAGISHKTARHSIKVFVDLGFLKIHPAKNGLQNRVEIMVSTIQNLELTPSESIEGTPIDSIPPPIDSIGGPYRIGMGTPIELVPHLIYRYSKYLSRYEESFFENEKKEKFKSDIERLFKDGFTPEVIEAVLEIEVESREKIQNFYAFIKSKQNFLGEITEKYQFIQSKKENDLKKHQERIAIQSKQAEETKITVSPAMLKRMGPKNVLNQNKGEL